MSTILKSLRKLEEEKRGLERKLNLKDLMIREEKQPRLQTSMRQSSRHWWGGALFIGAGLAIAGFMITLMLPAGKTSTPSGVQGGEGPQASVPVAPGVESKTQALGGVPLSSIPDYSHRRPKLNPPFIPRDEPRATVPEPVEPVPASTAPTAVVVPGPESEPDPGKPAPQNADEQIISAFGQVPAQQRRTLEPSPPPVIIRPAQLEEVIPGFKLKGIVYFSEGSDENYLFFTLPGMSIHRLKVGETVMDARLIEIHPGLAIFDYNNQRVELRVGS